MRCSPLLLLVFFPLFITAQDSQPSVYEALREYEGEYEYFNKSTLDLAASPIDNTLYAIILESRYPLRFLYRDQFVNNTSDTVTFQRDESGKIKSYTVKGATFSYLKKTKNPPVWYARAPEKNGRYTYKRTLRPKLNDGIEIGALSASGLNKTAIQEMMSRIIDGTYADVHSVLLLKDNKLVTEEYFYEYDRNNLHQLRSATKSFVSALVGIALGKGMIKSIDAPVLDFFPEYVSSNTDPDKRNITIRHLLANTSGLDCDIRDPHSPGHENLMGNSDDWVKFTLELPLTDEPGTKGKYCSGNVIVLGKMLEKASGQKLEAFAREHLFKPLGITQFKWDFKPNRSSSETFCQLYLRPRDMAKFGLLYLNGGQWKGKQIIPPGWIKESMSIQSKVNETDYGYLWWLQWLESGGQRYDGCAAKGNGGQRIYLFPKYNLVAVITAGSYNIESSSDEMLIKHVLPYLQVSQR